MICVNVALAFFEEKHVCKNGIRTIHDDDEK